MTWHGTTQSFVRGPIFNFADPDRPYGPHGFTAIRMPFMHTRVRRLSVFHITQPRIRLAFQSWEPKYMTIWPTYVPGAFEATLATYRAQRQAAEDAGFLAAAGLFQIVGTDETWEGGIAHPPLPLQWSYLYPSGEEGVSWPDDVVAIAGASYAESPTATEVDKIIARAVDGWQTEPWESFNELYVDIYVGGHPLGYEDRYDNLAEAQLLIRARFPDHRVFFSYRSSPTGSEYGLMTWLEWMASAYPYSE